MTLSKLTIICILGYSITQALICQFLDADIFARILGIAGGIPIGWYCAIRDNKEQS